LADTSKTPLKFAVVGGGISGLTAAYRLTKLLPQARVEIFEASDRLGGVLATHGEGDFLIERGADSFITREPWGRELCEELGLSGELIPTNTAHRRALVLHYGKLHPVPAGFVLIRPQRLWPIIKTPLLSWPGKLRLIAERWRKPPQGIDHDGFDDNLAHFASERLGREAFEHLVEPLVAGIYTADANQLSVAATMPEALEALRKNGTLWQRDQVDAEASSGARYGSFVTLRGGMGRLVEALRACLPAEAIHLNQSVEKISHDEVGNWRLRFADGTSSESYAGVVLAVPAPRAAALIGEIDALLAGLLGEISYASSAVVSFAFRGDQIERKLDGFGFVVPKIENRDIIAASFSSVKFPGRAPDEMVLIRTFLGGALRPDLVDLPDAELERIALAELTDILGISGPPTMIDVVKWREKMPQYRVGHLELVQKIEERAAGVAGLALAGNGYRGVGIPYCVRSGDEAARRVTERFLS